MIFNKSVCHDSPHPACSYNSDSQCVYMFEGKWQYSLFHFIYSGLLFPFPLFSCSTFVQFDFIVKAGNLRGSQCQGTRRNNHQCVRVTLSKNSLKERRVSFFWSLRWSQLKTNTIFCFFRCRTSISIWAKTPIAVIYLSSVKDIHQKHCLHFNAPLAADRLPVAFNGTGKLNEVKGIDYIHAWETKEEGNLRNA